MHRISGTFASMEEAAPRKNKLCCSTNNLDPNLLQTKLHYCVRAGSSLFYTSQNLTVCCALTLSPLAVNFEDRWWPLQTIWIQMQPHKMWGFIWDPNCLTFRLYISKKKWVETMNILKILKETNIWKNYPACKELTGLVQASSQVTTSNSAACLRSNLFANQSIIPLKIFSRFGQQTTLKHILKNYPAFNGLNLLDVFHLLVVF